MGSLRIDQNNLRIFDIIKMFAKNKEEKGEEKDSNSGLLKPGNTTQPATTAGKVGKSHHQFLKVMAEKKPGNQNQAITPEELAKHNTLESAWCSLNGTVYDVTVYMSYHPGGKQLLDGCGKECIDLFNQHHPWVNAQYLLEKYRIGFLARE